VGATAVSLEDLLARIDRLERNLVMPDGRTIGQAILPRLTEVVNTGRLLPAATGAQD
jgi:hypothetical protein